MLQGLCLDPKQRVLLVPPGISGVSHMYKFMRVEPYVLMYVCINLRMQFGKMQDPPSGATALDGGFDDKITGLPLRTRSALYRHLCTLFASYLDPICTLSALLHLICILSGPYLHLICTLSTPYLHPIWTLSAPYLHLFCTVFAPYLHHIRTLSGPYLHPICTISAPYLPIICTLSAAYKHPICTLSAPNPQFYRRDTRTPRPARPRQAGGCFSLT